MFENRSKKGSTQPARPVLTTEERQRIYDAVRERQWKSHANQEWVAIGIEAKTIIAAGDYAAVAEEATKAGQVFFLVRSKYFSSPGSGPVKSVA